MTTRRLGGLRVAIAAWAYGRLKPAFSFSARYVLPPVLADALRRSLSEFRFEDSWPDEAPGEGWDHGSIARSQAQRWPLIEGNLRGTGPLGVSHLPGHDGREDTADHNIMMSFGYVLATAARDSAVSILDWGGGAGHYMLYAKALFPRFCIDYHCLDLPGACAIGRERLPEATFHEDASSIAGRKFDLVLSSSSLHYSRDWRSTLRDLARYSARYVYVARLQTTSARPSFMASQTPLSADYRTRYMSWFLNRDEVVLEAAEAGLRLTREFVYEERWHVRGAPEQGRSRGFLFALGEADPEFSREDR